MAIYSDSGYITGRDTPLIRPTLDLNFAREKRLDSRVLFTRGSSGTYTDEGGVIRTAANNVPRFDHDPATGESLGLLIEEQRINIIDYSTNFAIWSDGTGSGPNLTLRWIQSNVAIAPDGTNTASKLIPSTQSDNQRIYKLIGATDQYLNQTLTFSVFAKAGEYSKIFIRSDSGNQGYMYVNLTDGSSFGIGSDVLRYSVDEYPNNWYRISLTAVESDSSSGNVPWISIVNDNDTYAFTGDGSEDGIYIWGAQVEVGSFATSYIPTSGSTATRAPDLASISGTNFAEWYNPTEGTFYVEADTINLKYNVNISGWDGNNNNYTILGTGASPNRFQLRFDDVEPYQVLGFGPNSTTAITTNTNVTPLTKVKIVGAVKQDYVRGFANGDNILEDNGFDMISPSALYIGSLDGSSEILPGHIKKVMYYSKILTTAQLQALTS